MKKPDRRPWPERARGALFAALDDGQRSRKQLAAVVRRLLYALRWSR
jgi:hypothetical protein